MYENQKSLSYIDFHNVLEIGKGHLKRESCTTHSCLMTFITIAAAYRPIFLADSWSSSRPRKCKEGYGIS